MGKSPFYITQMDCPSEEQMIRMKLEYVENIQDIDFEVSNRKLDVIHSADSASSLSSLEELKLETPVISGEDIENYQPTAKSDAKVQKMFWTVLLINFVFFITELHYGWLSSSMGLIADSLNILADSLVYGLSLMAAGSTLIKKKKVAKWSGYFKLLLAFIGLAELFRRIIGSSVLPQFEEMIGISFLALLANSICFYLLQKLKSREAHMQTSAIFTANNIIINTGVITAVILVYFNQSKYPNLMIGLVIVAIVVRDAIRILKLGK